MQRMICLQVRAGIRNVNTGQMVCTASKSGTPSKMSATAEANVDVTIGAKIDAQTDWDVVRTAVSRDVEERISRGFAVVPPIRFIWDYTQSGEQS